MNTNNKKEEILPFRSNDKLKEQKRKKKESICLYWFLISLIFSIIFFFIGLNQESGSIASYVCGVLLILGMISFLTSLAVGHKYVKVDNVTISKNSNTPSITCPYCKSTNTKKITNTSKAIHTAFFGIFSLSRNSKQWHCNGCGSDF